MDIRRTDLDGLATFHAQGPGPAQAWLVFRVGAADETLFTRGVTRLVGALAIDGLDDGGAAYGHFVGGPTTAIELDGTHDEVVSILRWVCGAIRAGNTARLEAVRDREILHSGWRVHGGEDEFLAMRFGPHGAGLAGQPELGLHHLGADEVDAWRRKYFTAENAALAVKNVSPEDLDLSALPQGARQPLGRLSPRPLPLPAWFESRGDVAVSSVVPASRAADAFTSVAVRRLRARLPGGGAHRAGVLTVRIWPGFDHVVIHCTAPDRSAERVRDALLSVLDELVAEGAGESEIAERVRELEDWEADPESLQGRLEWAAHSHVLRPAGNIDWPEHTAVIWAAREFVGAALFSVPPGTDMPLPYTFLPQSSEDAVTGRTVAENAWEASSSATTASR